MLALTLLPLFTAVQGVAPGEMAEIVSGRLALLDRLVVEVETAAHLAPLTANPLDPSTWGAPFDPGEGTRHLLRIVRPCALDEVYAADSGESAEFAYEPSRLVMKARGLDSGGRSVYAVYQNIVEYGSLPSTPVLQLFDLQMHESFVPSLNTERLLRDPSCALVVSDNGVNRYAATLRTTHDFGTWIEDYEFDLSDSGTPLRLHMTRRAEDGTFTFDREMTTLATMFVGEAELVSEAVFFTTNSVVDHYGVHTIRICSATTDASLTRSDVRRQPPRQNSVIWVRRADFTETKVSYGSNGEILTDRWNSEPGLRHAIAPAAALGGIGAMALLGFLSRRRRVS